MQLHTRNVNTAFKEMVGIFHRSQTRGYEGYPKIVRRPSRNGDTLTVDEPVIITYERPLERVLFNASRDCNPFFHLYEALWMLAGRNDLSPLEYYCSNFGQFSDNGKTLHGAYGYRWRRYFGYDQLDWIADELKANPSSRRCVLQMWDGGRTWDGSEGYESNYGQVAQEGTGDLYVGFHGGKDVPCNVCAFFSVRIEPGCPTCNGTWAEQKAKELDERPPGEGGVCPNCGGNPASVFVPDRRLDITVINRSNDLIWGALGANAVHFSFLLEYMAARTGYKVGVYHQISNNLHIYLNNWKPDEWLKEYCGKYLCRDCWPGGDPKLYVNSGKCEGCGREGIYTLRNQSYKDSYSVINPFSLVKDSVMFEQELLEFVELMHGLEDCGTVCKRWKDPFFDNVAGPALRAFAAYKNRNFEQALRDAVTINAEDWRIACTEWLQRRKERHDRKMSNV